MSPERFGSLVVLGSDGRYRLCRCECGTEKRVRIDHLRTGATVSCGCVGRAHSALAKTTHGMSGSRVFAIWMGMLDRCKNDRSGNYGQRGIKVCTRWAESFDAFYADMGNPPSRGHTLDRIDVNGHYQPDNCRWATATEQARNTRRNTRLTLAGRTQTIAEWAAETGLKPSTICVRLYTLGWPVERTLSTPVRT